MTNKLLIFVLILFILMNVVAYFHAAKFTRFDHSLNKTDASHLSFLQKVSALLFGVSNPRPENLITPTQPFETITLKSNKQIECWLIKTDSAKGTVILFHGYGGTKSSMLDKANIFLALGYNIMMVDFMGSGGSEGNQTTLGFYEAEEVKTCVDYLNDKGEKNIILFGTSMGAVAIMKAEQDYKLNAKLIIIECPFGRMLQTVQARFTLMGVPSFPMANLLVFWGGFQNKFDAFAHNPTKYAKSIICPALLIYGEQDPKVSKNEIEKIYKNLKGKKELKIYKNAGHDDYLDNYKTEWTEDIKEFLQANNN